MHHIHVNTRAYGCVFVCVRLSLSHTHTYPPSLPPSLSLSVPLCSHAKVSTADTVQELMIALKSGTREQTRCLVIVRISSHTYSTTVLRSLATLLRAANQAAHALRCAHNLVTSRLSKVLDEFDLFAHPGKQSLLYTLLDTAQASLKHDAHFTAVGCAAQHRYDAAL